jgi:threonine/homoserine/homoserine lactone efflux protein
VRFAPTRPDVLTFASAALVLIVIPGPDQALITRNALVGGRAAGLMTMLGGALGVTVHATAAAVGVSALLLASATAFTLLKVVGVAYLLWMGIQTLLAARRRSTETQAADERGDESSLRYMRHGFLSNSLNPKVALFFVTFLPQFLPAHGGVLDRALLLSLVFAALYVAWFSFYVVAVDRLGSFLRRPHVRARIEQVTGLLLVGFAVRLALHQHD